MLQILEQNNFWCVCLKGLLFRFKLYILIKQWCFANNLLFWNIHIVCWIVVSNKHCNSCRCFWRPSMSLDGGSVEEEVRKLKWAHLSIRVQIFLLTACYIGCRTNCWSPSWSMIQTTLFCKCLLAWWCQGSMQDDEEVHAMSSNWTRLDN